MNKVTWLVQTNGIRLEHVNKVWEAAQKYATAEEAIVIPFHDDLDNDPILNENTVVIPYGSVRLSKIGLQRGWKGLYMNDSTFDSRIWLDNRDDMLNDESLIMPLSKLSTNMTEKEKIFIRPCEDHKAFTGFVADNTSIRLLKDSVEKENHGYDENLLVSVSPVKEIYAEYRFFIVNGEVISGSSYVVNGRTKSERADNNLISIAHEKAQDWLPHKTCVMDLADVWEDYKVVEFNSLNSSGFYDHDVDLIVKKVTEMETYRI